MLKAYKYRLYPDDKQKKLFEKTFGCVRFYWNRALQVKLKVFNENKDKPKQERRSIPQVLPASLKKEYSFLREADSLALANAQLNLEKVFREFFRGNARLPQFKRKKAKQKYTTNNVNNSIRVDFDRGVIRLPKAGQIKAKFHRTFQGTVKSATVEKTTSGKYYVSVLVEVERPEPLLQTDKVCAIDLGLKNFAVIVDTDGNTEKINNPKYLVKTEKRLAKLQRQLSRKKKGSRNREKQRLKVARLYEKVRNQRKDFLHKLSKRIVSDNQAIILENLNVKGLLSNGNLSKHIADSSWSKFVQYLTYKTKWYRRELVFADSFFPSSRLCSVCGYRNTKLKLSDRYWTCPECTTQHDRDINTAKNLLRYGLIHLTDGRAGTARTKACGECSGGGTDSCLVYEPSIVEAGSSIFYKME